MRRKRNPGACDFIIGVPLLAQQGCKISGVGKICLARV